MNNLRSNTKIKYFYLVPKTEFYQLKLPRNRDVLEVFFGLRDQFGELEPKKNIALKIYDQICPIYKTGPFPMKKKQVCLENILKVHDTYRNVTKHIKEYDYDKPSKSISKFKESLDQLCDLSAKNIFEQIMKDSSRSQSQKVQDCDFLREQQTTWKGKFSSIDHIYTKKCISKHERNQRYVQQNQNDKNDIEINNVSSSTNSSTNSSRNDETFVTNYFHVQKSRDRSKKRTKSRVSCQPNKKVFLTPLILGAADRTNISSHTLSEILSSAAVSNGNDLNELTVSRSSIERERKKFRNNCADKIKSEFVPPKRAIVHFDGKLLTDLSGEYADRLAIMISGDTDQCKSGFMISAERILDGSGLSQKNEILRSLHEWNIIDNIVGMVFDTCSANTGWQTGAATLLESALKKALLWLPCNKHICELILKAAFFDVFGEDMSPVYLEFQEFYGQWDEIDKTNYSVLTLTHQWRRRAKRIIEFCNYHLAREKFRDDYKECIELVLVVLGCPPKNFTYKKPGAVHKARWMAPIIYTLKIFLFRQQLQKDDHEQNNLERFVKFIVFVYIEHWILCSFASDTTVMDLKLYKTMLNWQAHDQSLALAVLNKMKRHTWYLNQEFVPLSLFSNLLTDRQKGKIATALNQFQSKPIENYALGHPTEVPLPIDKNEGLNLEIVNLIGDGSMFLFHVLQFDRSFLNLHVSEWYKNDSFKEMENFVKFMKVTNESAERGVKLVSDFANTLTKTDSQRTDLLQVVQAHRKFHPVQKKSNFIDIESNLFLK